MRNLTRAVIFTFLFIPFLIYSQHNNSELPTSINEDGAAPDQSAILDLQSSNKGLLVPRMKFCDIEEIEEPAEGLMVFDTEFNCLRIYIQGEWDCLYERRGISETKLSITGWSNTPLDEGFDTGIDVDHMDNIYITTRTEDSEIRLIKYNAKGELQWSIFERARYFYDPNVDGNGNVFAVGKTNFLPFTFNGQTITTGEQRQDFICKTSTDGSTSQLLPLNKSISSSKSILDDDGNLIFAYEENLEGAQPNQLTMDKYDNNLNLLWSISFDNITSSSFAKDLKTDLDGNIYMVANYTTGTLQNNPFNDPISDHNVYTVKIDGSNGAVLWERNIGEPESIQVRKVFVAGDNVYVVGMKGTEYYPSYSANKVFIQVYGLQAQTRKYSEYERNLGIFGFDADISIARNEICFSVSEIIDNDNFEHKLIFHSLDTESISHEHIIGFTDYYGIGLSGFVSHYISYNSTGDKIFGVGLGYQAGNTSIEHNANGEIPIVFKILID